MTDTVTIRRELLEQVAYEFEHDNDRYMLGRELRAILDAPRQPEGDAISLERVQAEADAFFDWPTADKSSVTTKSCLIFARCIAGMVSAWRDATIAELRERLDVMNQCADNYSRMFEESAEECEHLKDCQENAMLHMTGLVSERDTLRQQLAERDAEIERGAIERSELRKQIAERDMEILAKDISECKALGDRNKAREQRDRLAGLLADVKADYTHAIHWEDMHATMKRIDAALAEVEKAR